MDTTRATIADALSTVEGMHGYAKRPKALRTGDAWALIDQVVRGPGQAFQTSWRIPIVVGPDESTATDQFDGLVPLVVDALTDLLYVDLVRAVVIPVEQGNQMFGIEIIGRSE